MQDATQLMLEASSGQLAQAVALIHAAIMGHVIRALAQAAEAQAQGQDAAPLLGSPASPPRCPEPTVSHWAGER